MENKTNKMWMQAIATETGFETLVIGDDDGVVADCHFSWRPYNENESNAKLIVSAVNGCKSINGDNPQVVAENITEMVEILKSAEDALRIAGCHLHGDKNWFSARYKIEELLKKISEVKNNAE